jgi:hypothetical protein
MGYSLRITRNINSNNEGFEGGITLAEWQSYVDTEPSLKIVGRAEIEAPNGETVWISGPGITVWTEHPVTTSTAWLFHSDDEITVKHPDQEFLAKMLDIAKDLNAAVIGDDGEDYQKPDDHGIVPSAARISNQVVKP